MLAALGVLMSIDAEARIILDELRKKADASVDGRIYGDRSKALQDIGALLKSPSTDGIKYLLAPTANLQDLAIENGWGNQFNELAGELDKLLGI